MPMNMPANMENSVEYEYKCPACKKYFTVNETESFRERPCPHCRQTVVPEPPGLNKGPILKVSLTTHQRRLLAVATGYLLGMVGAHKFILNYNLWGSMTLMLALILGALWPFGLVLLWGIGIIEATVYLLTPDDKFEERYLKRKRYIF